MLFLTHTLKPNVVVIEPRAAVAGIGGKEIWTLSILTNVWSKHLTLICIWRKKEIYTSTLLSSEIEMNNTLSENIGTLFEISFTQLSGHTTITMISQVCRQVSHQAIASWRDSLLNVVRDYVCRSGFESCCRNYNRSWHCTFRANVKFCMKGSN